MTALNNFMGELIVFLFGLLFVVFVTGAIVGLVVVGLRELKREPK